MIRSPISRKAPLKATTIKPSAKRMRQSRPKMTPARKAAKGQDCTLRLPGCYPGPENEQVQLCHLRVFGGGGTGLKPHDSEAVFGCTNCHDVIDGRKRLIPELCEQVRFSDVIAWALIRTLRIQREKGVLIFKGEV
jgi:hypothetical protein